VAIEIEGVYPLIQVFDMPASVHFYRDQLGFELVTHSPFYAEGLFHWAMLRLGGAGIMLNTAYDEGERPPEPDRRRIVSHRDTTLYFGCPDVDAAYEHLVEAGLNPKPPTVAHYGMKQLYLNDPDGYGVCFQWPESRRD
jgi:catechol 2,3-dioxygenase-like lactoylglutathione lyase family enzyme